MNAPNKPKKTLLSYEPAKLQPECRYCALVLTCKHRHFLDTQKPPQNRDTIDADVLHPGHRIL